MRELTLRQAPASLKVLRHVFRLFERGDDSFVDLPLVGRLGFRE